MTLTPARVGYWSSPSFSIDTMNDRWPGRSLPSSTAWGTANRAIYVPIRVPRRVIVRELAYHSGTTATGNIDVGLYDSLGARLVSSGSTAKSSSASMVVIDTTDVTIGPGTYYLALNNTTTTDTFGMNAASAPIYASQGVLTEAVGAVTLPATATWAVDNTLAIAPVISALLVTELA